VKQDRGVIARRGSPGMVPLCPNAEASDMIAMELSTTMLAITA
jgi:hypothetical protein